MRIVVGLGNPGREYANTRHNIGFVVVDRLARRHGAEPFKRRFRAEVATASFEGEKLVLVKPQTYMNLSGHAVREVRNWYHADLDDVLIVHDDLDLPYGQLRMRARGSAGGHNGMASIIEQLGTNNVPRLKIGIGRGNAETRAHVLARFSTDEERDLDQVVVSAADAVERWVTDGITAAMNQINGSASIIAAAPRLP
ncbi:MAG TPA: aminoacyl-tRNA hydrolase [Thermomicrobiales bacterium]|nr:aminoacyl-tRNA hydrolase [Thermomicrobiales bacterium]